MKRGATVIQVDPEILSGTPVFAGPRVPAETLFEYLERGRSLAEFLADFPTVTEGQAVAALEEAKNAWLAWVRCPAPSVIDLLDSWLEEDSKRGVGAESWEQSKRSLDRDRVSSRPLFPLANSSRWLLPQSGASLHASLENRLGSITFTVRNHTD